MTKASEFVRTPSFEEMSCKVCRASASFFGEANVLDKHLVRYFCCNHCGFVQTEEPYWLQEAYSTAITQSDIGLVGRNVSLASQTKPLIMAFFDDRGKFLDYGGGYGMFVRLMRDAGFDFYLYDQYCENLFAKDFQIKAPSDQPYELVTAFEVFEHLVDPMAELERIRAFSSSILFTTTLIASPPPPLGQWWYYGLEHGQHVALYSMRSLECIAQRLGLNLHSNGEMFHLFTQKKISHWVFRTLLNRHVCKFAKIWFNRRMRGRSLLASDFERIAGHS